MESPDKRVNRLQDLMNTIVFHDPDRSFSYLVENNIELFRDFKLTYSTNNINADFSGISLSDIEKKCSTLKKYFYGAGLLFYSDDLYMRTLRGEKVRIPIDYSLSLDSNAAERFRVWENGGDLDSEKDRFEGLVRFINETGDNGFNFDYSFFIIENLLDSMKPNNHRPFNSIRALKRFDHLVYKKENFDIENPVFQEDRETSGKRAIEVLHSFHTSKDISGFLDRRKVLYIILLKAVILRQQKSKSLNDKMSELIDFTLNTVGKFAKTELYFSWKLLKYGSDYNFFNPVSQLGKKSLRKIKGMSWDLFSIRYMETLASKSYIGDFFVPFFASFDNKFIELAKACPIRAVLSDDRDKRVVSIMLDEYEYQNDINSAITKDIQRILNDPEEKIKRLGLEISSEYLDNKVSELENEIEKYC